ncbi:protein kinase [Microbacterium lacus]|uniref:protein kinase domain-containing protein n=1 Tax=Microbacterium lacus TaxID=415217 RepID=UPI00384E2ECE
MDVTNGTALANAGTSLLGGRYELGTRLGEGGMGVVYQARDTVLGRTVAVKVFRDGAAAIARTTSEVRLLAGLNHPALVTLFDAQVGENEPLFLVMEYVDGPSLDDRLTQGALSHASVSRIGRDLAEALHVVHQAGIVHRDIKPANVLLRASSVPGEEFHAKLADFGIAYLVDSTRLTTPGTVIGSVAYLSPEQVTGSAPLLASDIYSLGLLLLEALTGQRAFPQIAAHEAALARLSQEPIIPSTVGPGWAALLSAMTAREPSARPTALEAVVAITRLGSASAIGPAGGNDATIGDGAPATHRTVDAPTLVVPATVGAVAPRAALQTAAHLPVEADSQASNTVTTRRRQWRRPLVVLAIGAGIASVVGVGGAMLSAPAIVPAQPAIEEPLVPEPVQEPALAPENPAPENPAPENPAPENPAPENPAPENPAPENPAPESNNSGNGNSNNGNGNGNNDSGKGNSGKGNEGKGKND